nr:MAG TPA: hypothetical protein [Caudoviricetes sp.]
MGYTNESFSCKIKTFSFITETFSYRFIRKKGIFLLGENTLFLGRKEDYY